MYITKEGNKSLEKMHRNRTVTFDTPELLSEQVGIKQEYIVQHQKTQGAMPPTKLYYASREQSLGNFKKERDCSKWMIETHMRSFFWNIEPWKLKYLVYKGVFHANEIPAYLLDEPVWTIIVNNSKKCLPPYQWITLSRCRDRLFAFSSIGEGVTNTRIKNFAKRITAEVEFNTAVTQPIRTYGITTAYHAMAAALEYQLYRDFMTDGHIVTKLKFIQTQPVGEGNDYLCLKILECHYREVGISIKYKHPESSTASAYKSEYNCEFYARSHKVFLEPRPVRLP